MEEYSFPTQSEENTRYLNAFEIGSPGDKQVLKLLGYGIAGVIAVILTLAILLILWSAIPVSVDREKPDPAVELANSNAPNLPAFSAGFIEHDGHSLHYVEAGEGDPIIFVHGFPSFWYSMIRQADAFRADHRVILIDGLGVGRSDVPKSVEKYSLEKMTEHLNALLRELSIEKAHLVGHDWGAGLVFAFAQKYPEQVNTVSGISGLPPTILLHLMETNEQQQEISKYVDRFKQANPILLLLLQAPNRIWKNPYLEHVESGRLSEEEGLLFKNALSSSKRLNAHINWYRANLPSYADITDEDYWPGRNARVEPPALLVWGNDDRVYVPEFIDELERMSNDLQVVRFDGVGHWPHLERPEEVIAALRVRMGLETEN